MLFESLLAVALKKEIERLCQCSITGRTQQVPLDLVNVGISSPNYTEGFKDVFVYVFRGAQRPGQFSDRRCRYVHYTRRGIGQPRMSQNVRYLKRKNQYRYDQIYATSLGKLNDRYPLSDVYDQHS